MLGFDEEPEQASVQASKKSSVKTTARAHSRSTSSKKSQASLREPAEWVLSTIDYTWETAVDKTAATLNFGLRPVKWGRQKMTGTAKAVLNRLPAVSLPTLPGLPSLPSLPRFSRSLKSLKVVN